MSMLKKTSGVAAYFSYRARDSPFEIIRLDLDRIESTFSDRQIDRLWGPKRRSTTSLMGNIQIVHGEVAVSSLNQTMKQTLAHPPKVWKVQLPDN